MGIPSSRPLSLPRFHIIVGTCCHRCHRDVIDVKRAALKIYVRFSLKILLSSHKMSTNFSANQVTIKEIFVKYNLA